MRLALLALLSLATLAACPTSAPPQLGDACSSIADCAGVEGLACSASTCQRIECARTTACPIGAACVRGLCGVAECLEDADCTSGECFEGECVTGLCEGTSECDAGLVCRGVPPTCQQPPEACVRDEECPTDQVCRVSTGGCVDGCAEESECDERTYCDGRICRSLCVRDNECGALEACSNGRCAPRSSCAGAPECPEDSPTRDPVTCQCFECRVDSDCDEARGEACLGNTCVYCPTRASEPESCAAQGFVFDRGCCLRCVEDADCNTSLDEVCEAGRCLDPIRQTCLTDADCPSGLLCDGERCVEDPSTTSCSTQAECPEGRACFEDGRCRLESMTCSAGCAAPSRCVASPGDSIGACIGCTEQCSSVGCPSGQACHIDPGAAEGYCIEPGFFGLCD